MSKTFKVYLAGAMEKTKDNGRGWRYTLTKKLTSVFKKRIHIHNPCTDEAQQVLKKYGVSLKQLKTLARDCDPFISISRDIWDRDMDMIRESDILIVRMDSAVLLSSGTLCEMSHAKELGIPVLVMMHRLSPQQIPLWTIACIDEMFYSWGALVKLIPEVVKDL